MGGARLPPVNEPLRLFVVYHRRLGHARSHTVVQIRRTVQFPIFIRPQPSCLSMLGVGLTGNNIPVFFIRDSMAFPDLVHSLRPNPKSNVQEVSWQYPAILDWTRLIFLFCIRLAPMRSQNCT